MRVRTQGGAPCHLIALLAGVAVCSVLVAPVQSVMHVCHSMASDRGSQLRLGGSTMEAWRKVPWLAAGLC